MDISKLSAVPQSPAPVEVPSPAVAQAESHQAASEFPDVASLQTKPEVAEFETQIPALDQSEVETEVENPATKAADKGGNKTGDKGGRKARLIRKTGSFRPGQSTAKTKPKTSKTLLIRVPSMTENGVLGEAEAMMGLSEQLKAHESIGRVALLSIGNGAWDLRFNLVGEAHDDDQLLSDAFRALNTLIAESPPLQQGFGTAAQPEWKFYDGNAVLDDGYFR